MNTFFMNGYLWHIRFVDPYSELLVDRTNTITLATTDPATLCVNVSSALSGYMLFKVLIHEFAHCAIFSYDLDLDIHRIVRPEYWIIAEEWVCNFMADYGLQIFRIAYDILGNDAINIIPYEFSRLVS